MVNKIMFREKSGVALKDVESQTCAENEEVGRLHAAFND